MYWAPGTDPPNIFGGPFDWGKPDYAPCYMCSGASEGDEKKEGSESTDEGTDKDVQAIIVDQAQATVTVHYSDGTSETYPAAVGDGKSYPGADSEESGEVKGTAWGAVGPWDNTKLSWQEDKDNPFGAAIILVKGTGGKHIHGTNGPIDGGVEYLGGANPEDRKITHGCARVTNRSIVKMKGEVDATQAEGKNIPVRFKRGSQ
jgi:hypothetical protein